MTEAFELLREQQIPEINSMARFYRHRKTGAEVLSLINDDENKVFGVTFKTPPDDSTGVAHILEHSVLCGSRKYPVKKPFVELLKGSLHTFLNAMTFPDKTAYPVASTNLQDFYNLVDVYLDAVFFPLISEDTFRQEGWHYEAESVGAPLAYKGVVFNEMKGVFSSPEAILRETSQRSLYPDTTYGVNSGGDPKEIPHLTYTQFRDFHRRFYNPSNTRAFFYGDDDPAKRLEILDSYFSEFDPVEVNASIGLQPRFNAPRQVTRTYAGNRQDGSKRSGYLTVNWMLDPIEDPKTSLALGVLETILVGTSAAPLRKALTDSKLGESFAGGGFADDYKQPMATFGLKGIDPDDADKVEALILDTLTQLSEVGIDPQTVEAALNTVEFQLRENNTGSFPRGISLMLRSMRNWLHEGDPFEPLQFEDTLAALKADVAQGRFFEGMIRDLLLDNPHRTTVLLKADPDQAARDLAEEQDVLASVRAGLDEQGLEAVVETTEQLKALQQETDSPEQLAKIPTLTLADLPREGRNLPIEVLELSGTKTLFHDLKTNGLIYLDIGFDLHGLDPELLPYLPLFSRALLQTGTSKESFVELTQRIGRSTGGVWPSRMITSQYGHAEAAAWLFLRGKATPERAGELLAILRDVIFDARLDDKERIVQMALEEKAGYEARLVPGGNGFVAQRLRAGFSESDWINEQLGGITHLFWLRELVARIETDWPNVQAQLERIRELIVNRTTAIANVTTDAEIWSRFQVELALFLADLPEGGPRHVTWNGRTEGRSEGLTIPAQVNYVGKGANLFALGYEPTGAASAALKHLNTTYLWDKVRVQGGAYGGSGGFDHLSGGFVFTSYRDPNLLQTLDAYDGAADFLRAPLSEQDLTRSIIGAIGSVDAYMLPDAKGFTSLVRYLTGTTDERRQQRREELLGATQQDFAKLGDALAEVARTGKVVVLGSKTAIEGANAERGKFLEETPVL